MISFADHALQILIHNLDSDLSREYSLRRFQLAKSPIELNAGFESIYLCSELEFLEDPSGAMNFEQVLRAYP